MDLQQLSDIETELDMSIESAAAWLQSFIDRVDLEDVDYQAIEIIIDNLYETCDFIRQELDLGGDDLEDEDEEDDYLDPHFPSFLEEDDEDVETYHFAGSWDAIRFLEDENGETIGIQVDFVK